MTQPHPITFVSDRQQIPARLLLADDHPVVLIGVRFLLANQPSLEICGEAQNGIEAVKKVVELSPDLVILDLSLPILNRLDSALEIKRLAPPTKIILFSIHEIPSTARIIGADAFVQKGAPPEELVLTIKHLLQLD